MMTGTRWVWFLVGLLVVAFLWQYNRRLAAAMVAILALYYVATEVSGRR